MATQGGAAPADGRVDDAIAVVGMACRFPGEAADIESFWSMLRDGRDAWSEIPADRFNAKGWYHPDPNRPGSFHIRGAHFLKGDIAAFDAPFFSISTAEAVSMDPQQRMLLEVVYEALDSAGMPVSSLANSATSVFCGSFVRDYEQPCMRDPDTTPPYSATGNGIAILANRVSHAFDFAGTSQTIDTGCSASTIAVHQACKSLLSGESNMGVAAGVGLIFSPNTLVPMANLNILSPDGRCFTFDERANGYGRGEGVGVVVLKRLKDAVAANDTIRAVIRASASNQDGHTQGITLPSQERQVQNMTDIYRGAGLDLARTAYMECHGTGTQVGDMKETYAVTEVFCKHRTPANPLIVGSVKTNIGHLEGSAGVAGIIKGILVVERGFIPKHLNFVSPNPNIDFEGMKLKIVTELTPWPTPGLRRASVNSFGFGGTNAHVVLDDAPHFFAEHQIAGAHHNTYLAPGDVCQAREPRSALSPRKHLFVFSGHDEPGLLRVTAAQANYVASKTAERGFEEDYAYTLLARRSRLTWRSFAVAASSAELLQMLEHNRLAEPLRATHSVPSRLAFVFCGQGAQWHAMGRELLCFQPFYASIAAASWYLTAVLGSPFSLWDELHRSKEQSRINEPQIAQPATTAIQMALVDLVAAAGLVPHSVVGHSSGEIAAAYAAGALSREDAWAVAFHRGQAVSQLAALAPDVRGGMLAVALSEEDARRAIFDAAVDSVDVACINGPTSVTLSGDVDGIVHLCNGFKEKGIRAARVNVSTAYHSRHMQAVAQVYRDALKDLGPPLGGSHATAFFSSVFGRAADPSELGIEYWVDNLARPVQFFGAVKAMVEQTSPEAFLEVSPHSVWESTLAQIHAGLAPVRKAPLPYAPLLRRNQDATDTVLTAMGGLWARGFSVSTQWSMSSASTEKPRHLADVPSYPWDHSRKYWHESHLSKANRFRSHGREDIIGAPLENSTPQDPRWRGFFRVQENPWLKDHVIQKSIIFPAGGMVAMAIEAAKQLADPSRTTLGFEVSDFQISKPMLIPTAPEGLEHMLSAHIVDNPGTSLASLGTVYAFSILSKPADGPWTTHASGRFAAAYCEGDATRASELERQFGTLARRQACRYVQESCSTQLVPRQFYEMLDIVGMEYGPQFRNLVDIGKGKEAAHAVVQIPDTKSHMPFCFEFDHIIHPATLDAMIQTVFALGDDGDAKLPCSADRIFVSAQLPRGAGSQFRGFTTAQKTASHGARAEITMFDSELQAPAVVIEGLLLKAAAERGSVGSGQFLPAHRNLCTEIVWKQDPSSISALGLGIPTSVLEIVDLAAHKNPALSVLYHIPEETIPDFENDSFNHDDARQLDVVAETLKLANLVLDNLTAGYDTPRFSRCLVSGPSAEKVWRHMRILKGGHPGFERLHHAASIPDEGGSELDVALCSVAKTASAECLANLCSRIKEDGWLILLSKLGEVLESEQHEALRRALEDNGFRADKVSAKSCVFLAAQKTARATQLDEAPAPTPSTGHVKSIKAVVLLPEEASALVTALKDAVRPVLEKELSTDVRELSVSSLSDLAQEDVRSVVVLSLVEIDTPAVFGMGPHVFAALQTLLTRSRGVLWLSQGGQINCSAPDRSPFVGLARTLRSESVKTRILSLDLHGSVAVTSTGGNAAPTVPASLVRSVALLMQKASNIKNGPADPLADAEFSFSGGRLLVPRLMPLTTLNHLIEQGPEGPQTMGQTPLLAQGRALKLDAGTLGTSGGPRFVEDNEALRRPLLPNEVRIEVAGTNLLPDDILTAFAGDGNSISTSSPAPAIGTDVFGRVLEVGSAVVGLQPDSRVVACMRDTVKTHVIADEARVRQTRHSGEWQASCPTAFATAVYALNTSRRISKGDFVLVYGASTAYGQAAIRLALMLGSHVLVACTSPREKTLMREHFKIPSCHILDMGDTGSKFAEQVLSLTQRCGVDVVFDPTSRCIEQAFHCVAECGRVIRVAHRNGKAPVLCLPEKNASLETIDIHLLDKRRPAEAQRLASDVRKLLQMAPELEIVDDAQEYNMCDLQAALEHAASNLYTGPHILFTEADEGLNMVSTPLPLAHKAVLSRTATYLLVGGLGGLGRSIAEHLAARGARHIAFFSRSGAVSAPAQGLLGRLHAAGVDARVFATDVCDKARLAASVQEVQSTMPPIRGAFQCAAVIHDVSFASMDYEGWMRACGPKTVGSLHLHEHLPRDMDFLIFLSSSSGVIGNRGQANYAAGNAFQDALARHRSALGMHSVSVDLGLVIGAGMVAENESLLDAMKATGFIGIRLQDVLFVLDRAMARTAGEPGVRVPAQVVTTVGTGGLTLQNQPSDPFWTRTALFRYLNQVDAPPGGLGTGGGGGDGSGGDGAGGRSLRAAMQAAATVEGAAQALCTALVAIVARRKGMVPEDFDWAQTLGSYGIDSLDAMFVLGWISRETGVTAQTVDGLAIAELGQDIARRCLAAWQADE